MHHQLFIRHPIFPTISHKINHTSYFSTSKKRRTKIELYKKNLYTHTSNTNQTSNRTSTDINKQTRTYRYTTNTRLFERIQHFFVLIYFGQIINFVTYGNSRQNGPKLLSMYDNL